MKKMIKKMEHSGYGFDKCLEEENEIILDENIIDNE